MRTLIGAVAAITGAGSGIGRALAIDLAKRGADLALADIDEAGLAATAALLPAERKVTTRRVDVADRASIEAWRDAVAADFGRVSILVNNAGVSLYGSFDETSIGDLEWIMGINYWGPVYGTKAFLPLLKREPQANIVTISSVFGLVAPPLQVGYSSSKFAIRGFSEALRHELGPTTVRLTVVHPGGIKTAIAARSRTGEFADATQQARDVKGFERSLKTPPEAAAARIVSAILHDKPRLLIGSDAFVLDIVRRLFPARYMQVLGPVLDPKKRFRPSVPAVPQLSGEPN
jgi:NAD(P)-dependent dehydrogenase (short-subunit alcohol dehydrogenase family)